MKIQPIQSMHTNPYYKKISKEQMEQQTKKEGKDKLEISTEAKQLLNGAELTEREKKILEIKALIESGNYKINYEKTAEKLLQFWEANAKDDK